LRIAGDLYLRGPVRGRGQKLVDLVVPPYRNNEYSQMTVHSL
jgi:hypothetical protein